MLTLYTAVGKLQIRKNSAGKEVPEKETLWKERFFRYVFCGCKHINIFVNFKSILLIFFKIKDENKKYVSQNSGTIWKLV